MLVLVGCALFLGALHALLTAHRVKGEGLVGTSLARRVAWSTADTLVFGMLSYLAFAPHLGWVGTGEFLGSGWRGILTHSLLVSPFVLYMVLGILRSVEGGIATRSRMRMLRTARWLCLVPMGLLVGVVFVPMLVFTALMKPGVASVLAAVALLAVGGAVWRPRLAPRILVTAGVLLTLLFVIFMDLRRGVDDDTIARIRVQDGVRTIVGYGGEPPSSMTIHGVFLDAPESSEKLIQLDGALDTLVYYLCSDDTGRYVFASGKNALGDGRFPIFRYDLERDRLDAIPLPYRTMGLSHDPQGRVLWIGNEAGEGFARVAVEAFDQPVPFWREVVAFGDRPSVEAPVGSGRLFHWYPSQEDVSAFLPDHPRGRLAIFFEDGDPDHLHVDRGVSTWDLPGMTTPQQQFYGGTDILRAAPSGGRLYTQIYYVPPGLVEVDIETLEATRTMMWPIGYGFDIDPRSGDLFVPDPYLGRLHRVNPETLQSAGSMFVGIGLSLVAFDPLRDLVYVGNYFSGTLSVVSWTRREVLATAYLGPRVRSIVVTPVSHRVFATTSAGFFEIEVDRLVPPVHGETQ